jgi:hypothetical protein
MPVEDFDRARRQVLRRDGVKTANYEMPEGYYPLRQAIAGQLAQHGMQMELRICHYGGSVGRRLSGGACPGCSRRFCLIELPQYWELDQLPLSGSQPGWLRAE